MSEMPLEACPVTGWLQPYAEDTQAQALSIPPHSNDRRACEQLCGLSGELHVLRPRNFGRESFRDAGDIRGCMSFGVPDCLTTVGTYMCTSALQICLASQSLLCTVSDVQIRRCPHRRARCLSNLTRNNATEKYRCNH
ncbi:hypothetical protein BKA82DRAFT_297497 [Pisolithus tinctorius]|uniref:Uncharacterized protein n=1 Tax=Pisolithus tinctorius Marx 270 TaxID=870435 RepID=A0A0C3NKM2_PISTI|nr:hypothetical protein BKA82DRAFT_297497 [Pisolithus tinctorius]KIN95828.1 hypothetical protein M404DRAFT_297497 [Pisolithus tinctorius Marx 270]